MRIAAFHIVIFVNVGDLERLRFCVLALILFNKRFIDLNYFTSARVIRTKGMYGQANEH